MRITLTPEQMLAAAAVGSRRRILAIHRQRTEPYGKPTSDLWGVDIESSAAEEVVALATGYAWRKEIVADLSSAPPDVGDVIQVRWSHHEAAHLPIYDRDPDEHFFFLVTGQMPDLDIRGWIVGAEGKTASWERKTPRGTVAYWVPQHALTPVDSFLRWYPNGGSEATPPPA